MVPAQGATVGLSGGQGWVEITLWVFLVPRWSTNRLHLSSYSVQWSTQSLY
jgi:hypothetical protein